MADKEQLQILKAGVEAWNKWRLEQGPDMPDLVDAELSGLDLNGVDLHDAMLLSADLNGANLRGANLHFTNLQDANLSNATLSSTDLIFTDLYGADLSGADLVYSNLRGASLNDANLRNSKLIGTTIIDASLSGVDLHRAQIGYTAFVDVDFRGAKGLEEVEHISRSELGISTIYRSEGKLPDVFLRGCGLPESFIVQIPSLVAAMQPIQFYSCFISYSSKDQRFAERLHADLQNKGVRCWFAPEDLKIGEKIRVGIDESIRVHDKLLLILSKNSIESEWVEKEVETAMERERQQKRTILFPIRLDDTVLNVEGGWAADIRRSRNVGDFRRWKSHDAYSKAFERLLRDLQASA